MRYYATTDLPDKRFDHWFDAPSLTVLAEAFEEGDEVVVAKANPYVNEGWCHGKRIEGTYYRKTGGKLKKLNRSTFFGLDLTAWALTQVLKENPS
jgi:hypothetical protein|tara:strand:- start:760 stop:1044 length:285 start_codon:yes stop_codon:yes gene_type:complete